MTILLNITEENVEEAKQVMCAIRKEYNAAGEDDYILKQNLYTEFKKQENVVKLFERSRQKGMENHIINDIIPLIEIYVKDQ
jgi:hypothetical protein